MRITSELVETFDAGLKKAVMHTVMNWKRDHGARMYYEILQSDVGSTTEEQLGLSSAECQQITVMDFTFLIADEGAYELLQTLNERDKLIILLYYWREYSAGEIGQVLNRSAKTIHNRMSILRRRLREQAWATTAKEI